MRPATALPALLYVLLLAAPAVGGGQEPPGTEEEDLIELELAPRSEVPEGEIAAAEGTADTVGLRFILGGLSAVQPATVTLLADDPADDLRLELVKYDWTTPERSGSTRGAGFVQFGFHTEGFVKIGVRSGEGPKPFTLVAWVGEEVVEVDDNVLVSPSDYRGGGSGAEYGRAATGGGDRWPLVLGALLVGGILGGLVFRQRRDHA